MTKEQKIGRQKAVSELKRELILDAARKVFEADGLDGASLRAIAADAGYTPAALYFHFESKEAIYAEVLRGSLDKSWAGREPRAFRAPRLRPISFGPRRRLSFAITPTIRETSILASTCFAAA